MHTFPVLQSGDSVEIIAPASRCSKERLHNIKELLLSWKLNCIIHNEIFGDDLLCANSDSNRFQLLKNALLNPETKAVICARGGYGSMRLLPELAKIAVPASAKLFVGMSDITALHLFLSQKWNWPVIHGALAPDIFSPDSIASLKSLLFGETSKVEFIGLPLNSAAKAKQVINASVTGGNLCLLQTSLGTNWQVDGRHKIILLEETGERGYRVDRMLEHLSQAGVFIEAAAIVFADFIDGKEPNGSSKIQAVLERFAESCAIPVVQIKGVGHGYVNFPIPLGQMAKLNLGEQVELVCLR